MTTIDPKGRLILDAFHEDSWAPFLETVTPARVNSVVTSSKQRVEMELKLAKLLKIGRFYCDPDLFDDYAYERMLINGIGHMESSTENLSARPDFKIRVSNANEAMLEVAHGCLVLPVKSSVRDLPRYIRDNEKFIQGQFNVMKDTVTQVKDLYQLYGLTYALPPDQTSEQTWDCLVRLLRNHSSLAPYLNGGLKVHISKDYGFNERGIVSIRWDFLIDR